MIGWLRGEDATARPPLVGLETLDWARMQASDGHDAGDIPELLRRLASAHEGKPHRWADALLDVVLHGHSGMYLEPAEHVLPFLIALCGSERVDVAEAAVEVLLEIADTRAFHSPSRRPNSPELDEFEARVQAVLHAGVPTFQLLRSTWPSLQATAQELLDILEPRDQ
ncbi:hypothetical protein Lfu02_49410 [Longispora fulva]|uniref:Uncharacterized protein n=1 Tax=Longispora fulva TaxID=619741 RepID=A0A8J7KXT9_9ACTN|nr:hypothetical protein [Longispora fulva]MBG6138317.1 hypothetical protein [Longispora fulva]GIG60569.1 hypothetical protein Lfu02_49410 [Longispora fulva]